MARPIIPIAVRRTDVGRDLEVESKGGSWIPWSLLSPASRQNTLDAFSVQRYRLGGWPDSAFMWMADINREPEPQPDVPRPDVPMHQHQTNEQNQEQNQEQAPEPEPQPEPQPQPLTLEDMVRKIAGELDDDVLVETYTYVDRKLSEFHNETSPNAPNAVTRVEVRTPTQVVAKDGLFHQCFGDLVHMMSVGQHVYLPGPPGSGKSHAVKQAAELLDAHYVELSMSPDMPESRIWGGRTPDGYIETPVLEALRHAAEFPYKLVVVFVDEMDAGRPGLFVGFNSAMANCRVTAPNGDHLTWGDNVVFVGAANTFGTGPTAEFAGRNKLDAATLDRFAYIPWDTDPIMEQAVVRSFLYDDNDRLADAWLDAWTTLRSNVKSYGLKTFVTMRGARNGARLLASGLDLHKAMMLTIGNKLPEDQWAKVNPL
jgi:cobaltochelatase CobS